MRLPLLIAFVLALLPAVAGAQTEIRIIGSSSISEQELLTAIGGRLDHIRMRPASRARAADAAFMVESIFEDAGFNQVTVYWKIVNPRAIQLRVDEGKRDLLGEVVVEGVSNPKLEKGLVELFKLGPSKAARGIQGLPFEDSAVEDGMRLMEDQMKSAGWHDAVVTLEKRRDNPETGKVDFVLKLDRGKVSKIAMPVFEGETLPGIRDQMTPFVGRIANTENLNAMRSRVVGAYEEAGFLRARIRMTIQREGLGMTPVFTIERGQRFKLRNIDITGLEKTDPERIRTRLNGLKGTYLDGEESSRRIRQMVATGAFSNIQTDITPVRGEEVDVTLRVTEADARGLSGTLGFDSFEGGIIGGGYYDRNFLGQVRNLTAGFELTQRSLLGEVALTDPWIAGSDISGKLRLFSVTRDYEGYDVWRSGLEASAVWPVTEHYSIDALLSLSYVVTNPDGLPLAALGTQDYQNPFIRVTQRLDYRDNPVLPTSGWHLEMPLEIGAAIGGGSTPYFKGGIGGSYHYSLNKQSQLSFGARGGVLIPGDSTRLPIDLRYFNGGPRSVRSFRERELGPWSRTGNPVGGQAYWVANVEYIRSIAGPLKAVAFVDAGGLSRDWEDLGMNDPEVAAGLGLRLDLPIGPVRLEYGHNLTQDGRDPSGTWHFAIGTAF
ncbi:outer membrane protein assembly factor [Haloferula sp. A504]|uniref:outer membrane protein assembly factor n=1 Tax=Haloferula sp. A504 TaxID=3373601 RepID=UPI0031BE9487|nr:BamA/TamA family outer membrane protein [Verrucomicrobiaceae bacterium E54]